MELNLPEGEVTLDIFVENMGRINFGKYLLENRKGITGPVHFNGQEIKEWSMFRFPFHDLSSLQFGKAKPAPYQSPVIRRGYIQLDSVADTYLDMRTWGKGVVWVNGHNLGRYWSIGPQQTLYVPAEWLLKGRNSFVVLELLKPEQHIMTALSTPILNSLNVQ
jgi:beta-galactosidase